MAYFAQLDKNNTVINVISVENYVLEDENGIEHEQKGIDFLTKILGNEKFVQTSYNSRIRKHYAGIGFTYDVENDVFIPMQPYLSWSLNNEFEWESPSPRPSGFHTVWNEKILSWEEFTIPVGE